MSTGKEQFEREFEAFLAGEESGVADAYRKLPQPEPDARLDAAIKAMAHRALNPQLVATPQRTQARRRRARWVPALGAAAGVVLAAGIAFKLGPSRSERGDFGTPGGDVISVRPIEPPPPAVEAPLSPAVPQTSDSGVVAQKPGTRAAPAPPPAAAASTPAGEPSEDRLNRALERKAERSANAAASAVADEDTLAKSAQAPAAPAAQAAAFPAEEQGRKRSAETAAGRLPTIAEGGLQDLHGRDFRGDRKAKTTMAPALPAAVANAPAPSARPESPVAQSTMQDRAAAAPPPASVTESESGFAAATAKKDAASPPPPPPARTQEADRKRDAPPAPALREMAAPVAPRANAAAGSAAEVATDAAPSAPPAAQPADVPESALKLQRAPDSKDPNARLYPEHWLTNIRTMLREKHREEALRSLAEFRRLYPDYRLPDDLRDLK